MLSFATFTFKLQYKMKESNYLSILYVAYLLRVLVHHLLMVHLVNLALTFILNLMRVMLQRFCPLDGPALSLPQPLIYTIYLFLIIYFSLNDIKCLQKIVSEK